MANYKIAKFFVPLLDKLTFNHFSIKNSYLFLKDILSQNPSKFMASFDITSLFTNVPLLETIDLITGTLFRTDTDTFYDMDKQTFTTILNLATLDSYFLFNNTIYKQVDGVAMGSPLGPTLANIFMVALEKTIFYKCPVEFRPSFYRRYMDDTFALFDHPQQAELFLNFLNTLHPNISFTFELEKDKCIPFLDMLITRSVDGFHSTVYRKDTFTGLGINFSSYCPLTYKINAIKTLIYRAYHLSSSYLNFNKEIVFLREFFSNNGFPLNIFENHVCKFLDNVFHPKIPIASVPKFNVYSSFPHMGILNLALEKELKILFSRFFPACNLNLTFSNPLSVGAFFHVKESIPKLMRPGVVYKFSCPKCNLGTYIGCTSRMLKVRIDSHMGVSHRTCLPLNTKECSPVRQHSYICKHKLNYNDFTILDSANDTYTLLLLESLHIKTLCPTLNNSTTSTSLLIL